MPKKLRSKLNPKSRNMAKRTSSGKKGGSKPAAHSPNGGIVALTKELFQAAIVLRGSIEPTDYKRYVLPVIILRFLQYTLGSRWFRHGNV